MEPKPGELVSVDLPAMGSGVEALDLSAVGSYGTCRSHFKFRACWLGVFGISNPG